MRRIIVKLGAIFLRISSLFLLKKPMFVMYN